MDPWREAVPIHRRLAYVPGDTNLWPNLTGGEAIDVLTRGESGQRHRARRDELIERFELDPTKRARTYSKGNRQKSPWSRRCPAMSSCTSWTSPPRAWTR